MPMINELMGWNFNFGFMQYGTPLFSLSSNRFIDFNRSKVTGGTSIQISVNIF